MKLIVHLVSVLALCVSPARLGAADAFIVEEGRPRAEIVVTAGAPRTTRLAAQELQLYIEKISGAKLAIVTEPTGRVPVKVFIGRSVHTDKLGIAGDDLKYGAYRIISGDGWLAMLGDDTDFVPVEPWPRSHGDWTSGRVHDQWHRITDSHWGNPLSQLRKHYTGRASTFGEPGHEETAEDGTVHVWGFDERGSYNAVCAFLRRLGVRWYMPGRIGEVVPTMKSIPLPAIDQAVRPDFEVRSVNFRFGVHGRDTARWAMRLGIRTPYGLQTAHGLHTMTHNDYTLKHKPEWFALYGGKRHNQPGQRLNQLCYSNEELLQETVRFVRAQFDHYKFDAVSVMPPDGYTAICQCSLCEGKDTPERGYRGVFSDYVWSFVNRVAKEVRKTHPDKMVTNCAYGAYTLPPRSIEKLEPNVQVIIVGGRRPTSDQRDEIRELRRAWTARTDNPIMVFENYPFTDRGFYLPAYVPCILGESINATKGVSRGEDIWLSAHRGMEEDAVGFNHFLVYFTARMYWGGEERDVTEMLDEYCRLFYGPAGDEMKAFFTYCEANWREMEKEELKADRALKLFTVAKSAAEGTGVYAERIALIDRYLEGLRSKREQLAQKRGPVPRLRLVGESRGTITIDGKLDEPAWRDCPVASTGHLRELQTGRLPTFGTQVKAAWRGGDLYFAIRCEELAGGKLNIATTKDEEQAMWYGDVVEILLDTDSHSYYQIAVNPAGALIDLDRGAPRSGWFSWDSKAEVATQVAEDHWTVEIRIPVVQDENDPLHQVVGRKPTQSLPWHINVCRQRIRESGAEYSAFAPTGEKSFHAPMKFAHFYDGRSHQFDVDPTVTDFLIESRAAETLLHKGRDKDALTAYLALADQKYTDFQRSVALEQAALCARDLNDSERVDMLADRIPIKAVADVVRMKNLLAQRRSETLIERFGQARIESWPFWKRGEAFHLRGLAFANIGDGERAEADFTRALPYTPDSRDRMEVRLAMADNRETNLGDADAALRAYRRIADASSHTGSATYYRGVLGAARILREKGEHDAALAVLRKVDAEKLRGYWDGAMHLALGRTFTAAGRPDEARDALQKALNAEGIPASMRQDTQQVIEALRGSSDR